MNHGSYYNVARPQMNLTSVFELDKKMDLVNESLITMDIKLVYDSVTNFIKWQTNKK